MTTGPTFDAVLAVNDKLAKFTEMNDGERLAIGTAIAGLVADSSGINDHRAHVATLRAMFGGDPADAEAARMLHAEEARQYRNLHRGLARLTA